MTSQDQAALVIWQGNPREIAEMLLNRYFGNISVNEYEEQLRAVREEMGRCVIFISDLPPHLSSAF